MVTKKIAGAEEERQTRSLGLTSTIYKAGKQRGHTEEHRELYSISYTNLKEKIYMHIYVYTDN